jgi:SOUL heme-binding protein
LAAEHPTYEVIEREGPFELRRYAPMIVAETHVAGPFEEASAAGFARVAGYIFGNNRSRTGPSNETIAMTAPVTLQPESEPIDMTAPVTMQSEGGRWCLRFFMPSSFTLDTLPAPTDATVTLAEVSGATTAAVAFSGIVSDVDMSEHTAALLAWLGTRGLETVSAPRLARYSRPTTAPELRRNEILVDYR